jgi:hypothetical protein
MKKLITLLLLFTITLFYSIPTQAYTLDGNDIPIAELGGLTYNEVFRDSNLTPVYTIFSTFQASYTVNVNNIITITATGTLPDLFYKDFTISIGDVLYGTSKMKALSGTSNLTMISGSNSQTIISATLDIWYRLSIKSPINSFGDVMALQYRGGTVSGNQYEASETYAINLTALGIASLDITRLDYLFEQFLINNAYIDGYDDGFDVGYDEGFDDGVESDTSYAVGYALGLSEGEDMETGSSLLILIVALIGFVMMIFGFTTKRGIFNLLSVGAFVVLGTLLVQFVGFVIIAIGLVLINIYYAFFGDL